MKRTLLFFLCFVGFASAVLGTESTTAEEAVLQSDLLRQQAMMAGTGLDRLFSDAMVFVHSDGRVEGKQEYIKNLNAGDTAYSHVRTSALQAKQISSDVVVLTGVQEMRKKLGPTWSEIRLLFMSVWRNENGTWRIVAWQSARPAGTSVVPPK